MNETDTAEKEMKRTGTQSSRKTDGGEKKDKSTYSRRG